MSSKIKQTFALIRLYLLFKILVSNRLKSLAWNYCKGKKGLFLCILVHLLLGLTVETAEGSMAGAKSPLRHFAGAVRDSGSQEALLGWSPLFQCHQHPYGPLDG